MPTDPTDDVSPEAIAHARSLLEELSELRDGERASGWRDHERGLLQELDARPAASVATLSGRHPVLLLPARLETRFDGAHLLVRIYPDAVHVDTHERALTTSEQRAAERYWRARWAAGDDEQRLVDAAEELAAAVGTHRSGWVAAATTPTNPDQRPDMPLPSGTVPDPAPKLSVVDDRDGVWTRAPHTTVLPDRWLVRGRSGTTVHEAWSQGVPSPLVVGPDPWEDGQGADVADTDTWLTDFSHALEVGMAVRLPLEPEAVEHGLDELLVVGVRAADASDRGAGRLGALIAAHRYTDGAGLLPGGRPLERPLPPRSPTVDRDLDTPGPDSAAGRLAAALGVDPLQVAGLPGADARDEATARAALRALWRVTWHSYLDNHLTDSFHDDDLTSRQHAIAMVRDFVLEHLRPEGPLPLMRLGDLPYAIWPVTALERLDLDGPVAGVRDTVQRALRGAATPPARAAVRRLDPDEPDTLLDVLAHLPAPNRFWARPMRSRTEAIAELATLDEQALSEEWLELVAAERRVTDALERLGALDGQGRPRIARSRFDERGYRICAPFVQEEELSEDEPIRGRWLSWLLKVDAGRLLDEPGLDGQRPDDLPLLATLLRAAALLEYADLAWWWLPPAQRQVTPRREPEVVTEPPDPTTGLAEAGWTRSLVRSWVEQHPQVRLDRPPEPANGNQALAAEAAGGFVTALEELATAPSAAVERFAASALDSTAGRIDAWATSFASARLAALRTESPHGVHLGGWAYLRNVRPGTAEGSFVHAPSPALATTAAVLAQGQASHADNEPNPLDLDLAAPTAAPALELLRAVRGEVSLGEATGHLIERALRAEGRLDDVAVLRHLAPADGEGTPADRAEREHCDGLAVLRRYRGEAGPALPFGEDVDLPSGTVALPDLDATEGQPLRRALDGAQQVVDTVADLLLAEGVHQTTHANPDRAAAVLAASGRGGTPPDHLDVARPDRKAADRTLRVAVVGPGALADAVTTLADAAPGPAAIAEALLGEVDGIEVRCRFADDSDEYGPWETHTLQALGVSAIDLVLAADDSSPTAPMAIGAGAADGGSLARMLTAHLLAHTDRDPCPVEIEPGSDAQGAPSLARVWTVAAVARDTLSGASPLTAAHLTPPEATGPADDQENGSAPGVAAWRDRITAAREALDTATADQGGAGPDPTAVREAIADLVRAGLLAAAPRVRHLDEGDLDDWAATASAAAERALDAEAWPATVLAWLSAPPVIPGADGTLVVVPADEVEDADGDRVRHWLQRCRPAREGVRDLQATTLTSEAGLGTDPIAWWIAQDRDGPWLAGPSAGSDGGAAVMVGMATPGGDEPASGEPVAGFLLDEWHEAAPVREVATTLAMDAPGPRASPPQAALLAVPPDDEGWSVASLTDTVQRAVAMANTRMLPPTEAPVGAITPDLGHLLPATLLLDADADLRRLACPPERPTRPR